MNSNIFRIIVFFVILLFLPLLTLAQNSISFQSLNAQNIKIYFSEKIEAEEIEIHPNGIGSYIQVGASDANKFLKKNCFSGITFESALSVSKILKTLNAKIISKQNISILDENKTIIYAYTDKLSNFVVLNGQKVNIQILVGEKVNLIGHPLLLGSY